EKGTFKLFGNHVALRARLPTEAGSKAVTRLSRPHDALRSPGPLRSSLGYRSLLLRHDVTGELKRRGLVPDQGIRLAQAPQLGNDLGLAVEGDAARHRQLRQQLDALADAVADLLEDAGQQR